MAEPYRLGHGKCIRETDKALLIQLDESGQEVWFPKSHIHDDSEVFDEFANAEGEVVVTRWIAEQKGLV